MPSLLSMAAATMYPVPSRVEMIQAMRVASDEANAEGSTLLARYYEDHPELATGDAQQAMNDFNLIRVAVGAEVERRVRPVLDRYTEQLAAQQRIVGRARYVSPAILMQDALNDIAGTGAARHGGFMGQVERYHEEWRGYFVRLIFEKARLADYSRIPRSRCWQSGRWGSSGFGAIRSWGSRRAPRSSAHGILGNGPGHGIVATVPTSNSRHTFCSQLVMRGATMRSVQELVGHRI